MNALSSGQAAISNHLFTGVSIDHIKFKFCKALHVRYEIVSWFSILSRFLNSLTMWNVLTVLLSSTVLDMKFQASLLLNYFDRYVYAIPGCFLPTSSTLPSRSPVTCTLWSAIIRLISFRKMTLTEILYVVLIQDVKLTWQLRIISCELLKIFLHVEWAYETVDILW